MNYNCDIQLYNAKCYNNISFYVKSKQLPFDYNFLRFVVGVCFVKTLYTVLPHANLINVEQL